MVYAKLYPHFKRSINVAYLENGRYDQIVALVERQLEWRGLEADGKLPIATNATTTTTMNRQTQPQDAGQQQIFCRYCKKTRICH